MVAMMVLQIVIALLTAVLSSMRIYNRYKRRPVTGWMSTAPPQYEGTWAEFMAH